MGVRDDIGITNIGGELTRALVDKLPPMESYQDERKGLLRSGVGRAKAGSIGEAFLINDRVEFGSQAHSARGFDVQSLTIQPA